MPYADYFHDLLKQAGKQGLTVVFVPKKTLLDYEAMNPEAARVLGFKSPPGQIEILKGLPIKTQYADLHHELIERYLMKHGWKYFPAHAFSLAHEKDLPGELKILKVHDDGDLTIEYKGEKYVVTTEGQTFKEENMPAKSEQQRKLFGTALAMNRGEQPITETPAGRIAKTVPEKKIREFAERPKKLKTLRTYRETSKMGRGLRARLPKPRFNGMKSRKVGMIYSTPVGGRVVLSRKPLKGRRR